MPKKHEVDAFVRRHRRKVMIFVLLFVLLIATVFAVQGQDGPEYIYFTEYDAGEQTLKAVEVSTGEIFELTTANGESITAVDVKGDVVVGMVRDESSQTYTFTAYEIVGFELVEVALYEDFYGTNDYYFFDVSINDGHDGFVLSTDQREKISDEEVLAEIKYTWVNFDGSPAVTVVEDNDFGYCSFVATFSDKVFEVCDYKLHVRYSSGDMSKLLDYEPAFPFGCGGAVCFYDHDGLNVTLLSIDETGMIKEKQSFDRQPARFTDEVTLFVGDFNMDTIVVSESGRQTVTNVMWWEMLIDDDQIYYPTDDGICWGLGEETQCQTPEGVDTQSILLRSVQ